MTCQLVLATDYSSTYGFFLYLDTNWNITRSSRHHIIIGYNARDFINYYQVNLPSQEDYFIIDQIQGNTGYSGKWYFNFTSSEATNPYRLCYKWSHEQTRSYYIPSSLSCPCTYQQALLDWRFWFGYFWGVSSRPHCATLLFSQQQRTTECCYDSEGSLIIGPNGGGSYLQYSPLFNYQQYFMADSLPYEYCCIQSKLCQLYFEHRPSSDCYQYSPPNTCEYKILSRIPYTGPYYPQVQYMEEDTLYLLTEIPSHLMVLVSTGYSSLLSTRCIFK